jgi:sensor domain CHASE-containing protein
MKLRPKVVLLLSSFFVLLGATLLLAQQRILLPSFAELERDGARTDMERVKNTLTRDLDLLYSMTADWGNWDATYRFMQDHDSAFIKSSMTVNAIQGYKADAVALVEPSGKFAWATAITPNSGLPMDLDLIARGALPEGHVWWSALRTGKGAQGLLTTNRGPMLAAIAPVLDGSGNGPYRGMVLLGRLVTDEEIARIGEQAQVKLFRALQPASVPSEAARFDSLVERDGFTDITHVFEDVAGSPALALRIEVPRKISARGHQVVAYESAFVIGAAALVLLGMIVVVNRSVLAPLMRMTHHAVTIGAGDDLTPRLDIERRDELGELAREFDRMVAKLADSRRQLVDRSFGAGIAENASGVLHNLGNAMTPLCVKVADLEHAMRAAPVADIDLTLGELARPDLDDARKSDLRHFLQLTSQDLAEVITASREKMADIGRHVQAIQAVLAEQVAQSRAPTVIETVMLTDLLWQSAELVSADLRARLSIELDPSVASLGPVSVPRVVLQQVFQNLIVNAAEAALAEGRVQGLLRIGAEAGDSPRGMRLHLSFSDDGVGIETRNLHRIFEKGFTTKSSATNSGIGLHWCANAVNAIGGELRAESAGTHRGAIIHLILPLECAAQSLPAMAA